MSVKPQVFSAFNISKEQFGAAQYDSVTHVLSIAKIVKLTSGLELQSLIKQALADVVLQPNVNDTTYNCNAQQLLQDIASIYGQVQEIVSISTQTFDFSSAEKMLFNARSGKYGEPETSELQTMLLDEGIDQRFVLLNKISVECAGALISYLEERGSLPFKSPIHVKQLILKSFMLVGNHVQNYLQVFGAKDHPNMHFQGQRREGMSLFRMLDKTKSPGGRQMLEKWVSAPLQCLSEILERQKVIALLAANSNSSASFEIQKMLSKVRSVRVVCQRIQTELLVGDLECLARFAYSVVKLYSTLAKLDSELPFIQEFLSIDQDCFSMLGSLIIETVDFEASHSEDRVVIAAGVSNKVDHLRDKFENLDDTLGEASNGMEIEAGVPVVAVYFPQLGFLSSIDITHFSDDQLRANIDGWSLKFQTDRQRYFKNSITSVLDRSPGDIFSLIVDAESEVSLELQNKICQNIREIARAYELISQLDCLQALAELAKTRGYCQPQFNIQGCIHIQQGRHPILEYTEDAPTQSILPNDIHLSSANCNHRMSGKSVVNSNMASAMVLMGPNASGKSIMLKQTALIVYMAHVGCHVPADSVTIGVARQIMAMGSVESLAQGTSALSADLKTVGKILDTAESDTLVLLDEFGRGTTPVDGMGLLCGALTSLIIHRPVDKRPCVLAVTHFQEIRNLRCIHELWEHIQLKVMKSKECSRRLVYLYKIGDYEHERDTDSIGSNRYVAYAIACARDAGISGTILHRAKQLFDSEFLP